MAHLASHLALTAPTWNREPVPVVDRSRLEREQVRRQRWRDRQSLFALAAYTAEPGNEAIFGQSLRNLWAVKNG